MAQVEWVEIIEPRTKEHMFANLSTGECVWEPPVGVPVKKTDECQWWELFDQNTSRFYYYNATSQKTVWHRPARCDIIPLAKLQTLKQNTEPGPRQPSAREEAAAQTSASSAQQLTRLPAAARRQAAAVSGTQTSPSLGSRPQRSSKHARCRAHTASSAQLARPGHRHKPAGEPAAAGAEQLPPETRYNGGGHGGSGRRINGDRRSLDPAGVKLSNNNSSSSSLHHSLQLGRPAHTAPPPPSARTLDTEGGSLARSISFMNGEGGAAEGRRSVEATPVSARRQHQSPLQSPGDYSSHPGRPGPRAPSRTGSVSSVAQVEGFATPLINRRGGAAQRLSESEDSPSPAQDRRPGRPRTLDSGLATSAEQDTHRSTASLHQREGQPRQARHHNPMKERSLTSLSLQVKKAKGRSVHKGEKVEKVEKSPSVAKISPLQQYILDQAKLSGYRWGDRVQGGGQDKRDSYIDSENESHRTGDDSDAFADDEAPSSDGMEERDDVSLISVVSSVGEEDSYLSEPTYNNLDPVWAQRHGFGPDNSLDIDAFSEEFDLRMRWGRDSRETCSTVPRPSSHAGHGCRSPAGPGQHPGPHPRPGSAVQGSRDTLDSGHRTIMNTSQLSDKTGSTLSVSASIHSTLSAGTLTDLENFAASNLNIQKKGLFRKKMSLKDVLSWQEEAISKPLTFVNEKSQKKEAVGVFKLVQIYMSDRKAKVGMTVNSVAQEISDTGYSSPGLRDEVYIQLCKQVSDNPRRESLRRGWELLAICLAFFPPSATFYPYLLGFIQKHRDPTLDFPEVGRWPLHVQISHYAGICNKRLERIGEGGRLGPRKPSLEDIDQSRLQIFRPSMFGGTLLETLNIQKDKFPNRRLPWILTTLTEQILALNGLSTEGIFRIPADFDEVTSAKTRYDQWEPAGCSDAHVPAALLKQWLRELYIPLIPDDSFYNEAVLVGEDPEQARSLVSRLPELHRTVLSFLIRFLQLFSTPDVVAVTKMDASNLSMVFAPNFLRCPAKDPVVIMENTRKEMAFVKTLIHHLDTSAVDGIS